MSKPTPIRAPLDISPKLAKFETAANGLQSIWDATEAINDSLLKVRDIRALNTAVQQRSADAIRKARSALKLTEAAAAFKANEIRTQLTKRNPEFDKEIRQIVRESKDPRATVLRFIQDGDLESFGACYRAPPALSGIPADDWAPLFARAKLRFTPELAAQERDAEDAAARLTRAITLFEAESQRVTKAISGSDDAIVAALTPKKDAADA